MREKRVIVGGTFGFLHKGHRALIRRAFRIGDYVYIGLTTDAYVGRKRHSKKLPSYAERKKELEAFAGRFKKRFVIKPLNDRFGPSASGDFDAIVVSRETRPTAVEINKVRKEKGLRLLRIVQIEHSLAEDGRPVSTLRIVNGEIDSKGRLLKAKTRTGQKK